MVEWYYMHTVQYFYNISKKKSQFLFFRFGADERFHMEML